MNQNAHESSSGSNSIAGGAKPKYLIVNADDYGYFNCVSRGILDCVRQRAVTAVGVFATSPFLERHSHWLSTEQHVDIGVHLNLTDRSPLSRRLANALSPWGGNFPGKFTIIAALATGRIKLDLVRDEWRAQIERCQSFGMKLTFLNSHQHVHMLPPLFKLARTLADEYGIAHVRVAIPEMPYTWAPKAMARDMLMLSMVPGIRASRPAPTPRFLGLGASGHLSPGYLSALLPRLRSGRIYELMCHPGYHDTGEITDPGIRKYHDHELELRTLVDAALPRLFSAHNVRLIGFRHLRVSGEELCVESEDD